MEIVVFWIMVICLFAIFIVDTTQKRRTFIQEE